MANLTQDEFAQAIGFLAEALGLQRLRSRFVRFNALVTRRRAMSSEALADQLYLLTGGLRREIPATFAFQSIWSEEVNAKLGEDGEKALEVLAERINSCLGTDEQIVGEKDSELGSLLQQYEERLAANVGARRARLDMLLKAVPAVAVKLRAMPNATSATAHSEDAPSDQ